MATTPQINFFNSLADQFATLTGFPREAVEAAKTEFALLDGRGYGSPASKAIDTMKTRVAEARKAQPAQAAPSDGYVPAKGDVHIIDGRPYRVYISQQSGRAYVKEVLRGGSFAYAPGIASRLTAETQVTAEVAAQFGHLNDWCIFCGRDIDTPESTAVGYGPVCGRRRGLPWGANTAGGKVSV